jgi:hypothetical protein
LDGAPGIESSEVRAEFLGSVEILGDVNSVSDAGGGFFDDLGIEPLPA